MQLLEAKVALTPSMRIAYSHLISYFAMKRLRLEGWDPAANRWIEVEVEASSLHDAAQIVKYRDQLEKVVDIDHIQTDLSWTGNFPLIDKHTVETRSQVRQPESSDANSLGPGLARLAMASSYHDIHREALFLGALKIAIRDFPGKDLSSSDLRFSSGRFFHYYLKDSEQQTIVKVTLSLAQAARSEFYSNSEGRISIDKSKKQQLLDQINPS